MPAPFLNQHKRRIGTDPPTRLVALENQAVRHQLDAPNRLVQRRRLPEDLDAGGSERLDLGGGAGAIAPGNDHAGGFGMAGFREPGRDEIPVFARFEREGTPGLNRQSLNRLAGRDRVVCVLEVERSHRSGTAGGNRQRRIHPGRRRQDYEVVQLHSSIPNCSLFGRIRLNGNSPTRAGGLQQTQD